MTRADHQIDAELAKERRAFGTVMFVAGIVVGWGGLMLLQWLKGGS